VKKRNYTCFGHEICVIAVALNIFRLPDFLPGDILKRSKPITITQNGGMRVEEKVLNAMKKAGKPVRSGEVAKMLGEDSKQVSKAINELKKQGKIVSPKRCFWEPA
jgi:hypothetical protein